MQESESGDHGPPSPGVGAVIALAELLERLDGMSGLEEMSEAITEFAVTHLGADFAGVSLRPAQGMALRLDDVEDDLASRQDALAMSVVEMTRFGGRSVTLDLYSRTADAFDPIVQGGVTAMARIIGHAVRQLERRINLEKALTTREMIGQAQGMLMERYHLTSAQAMEYLRRMSQDSQAKIREIADQLVSGDLSGDEPPQLD